jgi:hypothetical protein
MFDTGKKIWDFSWERPGMGQNIAWGNFLSVGGLSQEEPVYAGLIRFIPPLYFCWL